MNENDFQLLNSDNNYYLKKIEATEELEDLGISTDEMYLEKIILLQVIAKGNQSEGQRVWGEYSMVSQITDEPVLMNKAMSIALTKDEVADLIADLNKTYKKDISYISPKGEVGLIFSTTDRGHARSDTFAITLPKLGDWRFGYTQKFSAELIFHEFAHALDFNRTMGSNVHRHDFVSILDNMLVKYKDFIESKYVPFNQRKQILENNESLIYFHNNKDRIIEQYSQEEKAKSDEKKISQSQLYSNVGLTDDSFPVSVVIGEDENKQMKIDYLKFIFDKSKSNARTPEQKEAVKGILSKIDNENIILNKNEITYLNNQIQNISRTDFLNKLPFGKQITAGSILSAFQKQMDDLSKGVIADLQIKDKYRERTYDESDVLKKYKLED